MTRLILVWMGLLACSCAAPLEASSRARSMANRDLACAEVSSDVTQNKSNLVYAFKGCGRYVIYSCDWSSGEGGQCQLVARGEGSAWNNDRF